MTDASMKPTRFVVMPTDRTFTVVALTRDNTALGGDYHWTRREVGDPCICVVRMWTD